MWILVVSAVIILTMVVIYVFKFNKKNISKEEKEIGMFVSENKSYFPTIQIIENNTLIPDKKIKLMT